MSAPLIARRMAAHGLGRPRLAGAAGVVSWYGAVQGQEYGTAKELGFQKGRMGCSIIPPPKDIERLRAI